MNASLRNDQHEELHESPLLKTTCRYPADSWQMNRKYETAATVLSQYLGVSTAYKYDAKGHLAEASMPTCYEDYAYNGAGQRISMLHTRKGVFHYTYDAQGKLVQVNDRHFQYDELGRLAGITAANIPTKRFVYERVKIDNLDVDRLASFQDSAGKSYTYSYTLSNPLPVAVHSYGQPVVTYQWEEGGALPRLLSCATNYAVWQFGYAAENDGRLPDTVILTGSAVAYLGYWDLKSLKCRLGYDHLGTVKLIADPFNELVKELFYDSFGNIVSETEQRIYFPLGFAGGLRDIATGFVSFGYRDYDPTVGRFTTPDPALDLRGDGDIYDYCVDDPVNLVDAEGLAFTSAEAKDAARKGHKGISHPFGAKHGTAAHLSPLRGSELRDSYKDKPIRTYRVGQRTLDNRGVQYIASVNKYSKTSLNLWPIHEGFISDDGSSMSLLKDERFGVVSIVKGAKGVIGPDKPELLQGYLTGQIEYNADLIDEAAEIIRKKRERLTRLSEENAKLHPLARNRFNYSSYHLITENCQDFVDEALELAKKIAQRRGVPFIIRASKQ